MTVEQSETAGPNLFIDGNSFAITYGSTSNNGYPFLLAIWKRMALAGNAGVSGQRIDQMISRFPTFAAPAASHASKPIYLAEGGINDIVQGADETTAFNRFSTLSGLATAAGFLGVYWIPIIPWLAGSSSPPQGIAAFNATASAFNALVLASGLATVVTIGSAISRQGDGIHPDDKGYYQLAQAIELALP